MTRILTDPTITSFYNLSWKQINEINSIPQQLGSLSDEQKVDLCARLRQLDMSVEYYSTGWIQFIKDLFTGIWCKARRLRRTLPAVMQAVDAVASPLCENNAALAERRRAPLANKIKVLEKAYDLFKADSSKEIQRNLENLLNRIVSGTDLTDILEAKESLKMYANDALFNTNFSLLFSGLVTLRYATVTTSTLPLYQTKARRVLEQLRNITDKEKDKVTAEKVDRFFRETIEKMRQGIHAPFPTWYHATGPRHWQRAPSNPMKSMTSIVKDKAIKCSLFGAQGSGTYMSSQDEHSSYGDYTFCIANDVFLGKSATFASYLWVCTHHPIPITERTVAYIATSPEKVQQVAERLQSLKSKIPVISREASTLIHSYITQANVPQELPNTWKPYDHQNPTQRTFALPGHMFLNNTRLGIRLEGELVKGKTAASAAA